ncbi:MAG: ABC transporter permease [Elusimicrobia bacterium]|nr:ABC transporter permease [Elusimicrobiota bacterium]
MPILIGITLITFFIMYAAPGSPTDSLDFNPTITAEARARLESLYGLDRPVHIQYFNWLRRLAVLDFGNSFRDGRPAMSKIAERLPATILLNILALGFSFILALIVGVFSALKKYSLAERILTVITFICFAVPSFWVALLLMIFFGLYLGWLPISGLVSFNFESMTFIQQAWDLSRHLILPVFVLSISSFAALSRYIGSGLLDELKADYIKTAYAKGLTKNKVVFKHAFKNSMLPLITILGLSLPGLVGGSFIIETIFSYPGMGRLGFEAIMTRDYPVIMGVSVIAAVLTLAGNIIADITYGLADPRVKYE